MLGPVPVPPPVVVPDHDLVRPIGRGSYGEVWLARSVLGEFRAVKIIRQDGRHDGRPFEREVAGLEKFEPISRSHEGLVHILHAGRFECGFFYVMELADNLNVECDVRSAGSALPRPAGTLFYREGGGRGERLSAQSSPQGPLRYLPRTLRSELQHRGRLPVAECVSLALKLTEALAHLHGHGLVHRDLKPSNIIFVNGKPKLADIGLVASADASMSCVGTEGYLPPEGPGKPPADLYALGKVLYELATGRDRTDFPELPTLLRDDPKRSALEELNEVILKACEPDARRRYQTADAMHADLALINDGKSLLAVRQRGRRWAFTRRLAFAAGLVLALAAGVRWLTPAFKPIGPLIPRPLAVEKPYARFDVSPDGERLAFTPPVGVLLWDRKTSTTRRLEIRGADGWLTPGISGPVGIPRWAPDGRHLAFMPLRQIGGTEEGPTNAYATFLLDTHTGEAQKFGADLTEEDRLQGWCWQPDGQALVGATRDRRFFTLRLAGERIPWRETAVPRTHFMTVGGYSSDGRWVAVATAEQMSGWGDSEIWLVPHGGGPANKLTDIPGFNADPVWGPEGDTIYYVSDGGNPLSPTRGLWKLRIDLRTGVPRGPPVEAFAKKGQRLARPSFVADGRKLIYVVAEPDTRIFVAEAADLTGANSPARGQDPVLSPDGQTVYFNGETPEQQGIFAIDRRGRTLPRRLGNVTPIVGNFPRSFLQVSPDGSLLALPGFEGGKPGLFLLPTTEGPARLIEQLPEPRSVSPAWSPDGHWIAYAVGNELRRVSRDMRTREVLATLHAWEEWNVRWSPDGKQIAALAYPSTNRPYPNQVFVIALADRQLKQLTPDSEDKYKEGLEWHPHSNRLTYFYYGPERFSAKLRWADPERPGYTEEMLDQEDHWDYVGVWAPDGRHFHFRSYPEQQDHKELHVFDLQTKQVVHAPRDGGRPEWSRDGRTMVWTVGETKRYFEEIEVYLR